MTAPKTYPYKLYFQTIAERLKRNVRHRREELKLTVHDAAQRSDIHWRHWQKIESGKTNVTLDTIVRLAAGLEIDVNDLIGSELGARAEASVRKQSEQGKKKFRHRVHQRRVKR